jgi:hypothetical protein
MSELEEDIQSKNNVKAKIYCINHPKYFVHNTFFTKMGLDVQIISYFLYKQSSKISIRVRFKRKGG